jgi:hypothetical protein
MLAAQQNYSTQMTGGSAPNITGAVSSSSTDASSSTTTSSAT